MSDTLVVGKLHPDSLEQAARRVRAYCTHPRSGWVTYDLAAISARRDGHFDQVRPWDLLLAALMNGRPTVNDVAAFDLQRRQDFASRVAAVPADRALAAMTEAELDVVVRLCGFGFKGVWAPKTTKMAALYRPHSVPIMDSHLSQIYDFGQDGFTRTGTKKETTRCERIRAALSGLRDVLRDQDAWVGALREQVDDIPGMEHTSDLRLLDIVLWTSWDDQRVRDRRSDRDRKRWGDLDEAPLIAPESLAPTPVMDDLGDESQQLERVAREGGQLITADEHDELIDLFVERLGADDLAVALSAGSGISVSACQDWLDGGCQWPVRPRLRLLNR